ncbi:MAG: porin, partial [Planctomycetota bacterium]
MLSRKWIWAAAGAMLFTAAPSALAQDAGRDQVIDDLKCRLIELQKEVDRLREEGVKSTGGGGGGECCASTHGDDFIEEWGDDVTATWKDGFYLNYLDADEDDPKRKVLHQMRLFGRLHVDYTGFLDDNHPQNDTFDIARARLGAKGFFFRNVGYKVELDFAEDSNTKLKDAWINLEFMQLAQLKVGHFKTPV